MEQEQGVCLFLFQCLPVVLFVKIECRLRAYFLSLFGWLSAVIWFWSFVVYYNDEEHAISFLVLFAVHAYFL